MRHHSAALHARSSVVGRFPARSWRPLQVLSSALLLTLIGAAWIAFAPIQFGGQAAYVIVNGISMEPGFHRGDLVVLRQAPEYQVGDIVTYRHPRIGPVIHRIIALDGDRYIFKGDNNSWIDSYHPTRAECIGKLWVYIPSAGRLVEQLRIPRNMAILAAVLGCMVMITITGGADRRPFRPTGQKPLLTMRFVVGGHAARRTVRPAQAQPRTLGVSGASGEVLFFALAALACASLLLAIFAFIRPATRAVADNIAYEQIGTFSYSATAPAGVYDSGRAQTGDPVFQKLNSLVDVQFVYRLTADQLADAHGRSQLVTEISDVSGWKRAIELQPDVTFGGDTFTARGTLDLTRIQALIDDFEKQTGIQHQQYALAVVAHITLQGALNGQQLQDAFAPRLEFQLDRQQLQVVKASNDANNPFTQSQKGMLQRTRQQPDSLALLGLALEVANARRIGLAGLCLAIGGSLLLGFLMRRAAPRDESTRIQRTYGPLIAIRDSELGAGGAIVDVATIEDLAKLAEQHGVMILHAQQGVNHRYFVHDGQLTYRYQVAGSDDELSALMEHPAP
jgi:signal peptidase I